MYIFQVELRSEIRDNIPKLIRFLDSKYDVLILGLDTIIKLANYSEFTAVLCGSISDLFQAELLVAIEGAIPKLFNLLMSTNGKIRTASVNAIAKLAKHSEFQ